MYYIIRTDGYIGAFYHIRQRGIVRRVYLKGRWQAEQVIAENCRENFTAHYEDDIIYLFCQDTLGDIIAVTINVTDDSINRRVVLKNQSDHIQQVWLHPIIMDRGISIIYNAASAEDRSNYLMLQQLNDSGQWSPASRIDKYWANIFEVQRVARDHLLLFYQTRSPENKLGYREVTPEKQGHYITYYTTNYFVSDTSCLTTDNGIHTLFVVKSMFSSQLIYRRNVTGEFAPTIVLYEAQRIEKCLLFFVRDNLYITFMAAGYLFVCMSEDKGASFSRPVRYRNKFCQNPEKAYFISQPAQSENGMFLRQVYVDRGSPWDIQIIPDLAEDFFPAYSEKEEDEARTDRARSPEYADEIERLRNQITLLRQHAAEKDAQIESLTRLISERNAELSEALSRRGAYVSVGDERYISDEHKYYNAGWQRDESGFDTKTEPEYDDTNQAGQE
ncbi:MAG: hypothetical protein LBS84_05815 [Clostridiales bacterium]|jgi:hypothetical protein|nr:hypothetical protein [Clostridiales bacterium]